MTKMEGLDAHLLRVFAVLMTERSVTRAAVRLEMSQPAVSLMLGKLRDMFSDQLLVRGRDGMVPTERALTMLPRVTSLLADMEALIEQTAPFDAGSSEHSFTIASPDYIAPVFLSDVVTQVRLQAPNVTMVVKALGPDYDFESALARGEIDLVIGNWPSPPPYLRRSILLEDEVICLMRDDHPLAEKGLTREDYLAAAHIVPVAYSMAHRGVVETHLSTLRLSRARTVALSYFAAAPYLLLSSDLIFTTAQHFATYFTRFLPLKICQPPIKFPLMTFYLLWHDRSHHSPMHQWFRGLVMQARHSVTQRAR